MLDINIEDTKQPNTPSGHQHLFGCDTKERCLERQVCPAAAPGSHKGGFDLVIIAQAKWDDAAPSQDSRSRTAIVSRPTLRSDAQRCTAAGRAKRTCLSKQPGPMRGKQVCQLAVIHRPPSATNSVNFQKHQEAHDNVC